MSNIVRLHTPNQLDRLWEEYAALARAMADNPKLAADRGHVEQSLRAHARFAKAFLAAENVA